jgi:hypothetical protein
MAAQPTRPTLTNITYLGRQAVKFGAIGLVVLIVGRTVIMTSITVWKALNPEPPPPPTVGFGLLPAQRFPTQLASEMPSSYSLETPTGTLPRFGDRAKVYFMPKSTLGLFADQNAREIAADYDFVFEPEVLSTRIYRWKKSQPLDTTLQLDVQTKQMQLTTNYLSRPDLIGQASLPDDFSAVDKVKSFLRKGNLLAPDIATVAGTIQYLRISGSELVEAVSFSDADFLQVDLQRTPIDNFYQFYTPKGTEGIVSAILTGALSGDSNIVQLYYNYQPIEYDQVHTYPLRSTQEAWQVLQAGQGYIANEGTSDTAIVRRVFLGYYDDFEEQSYLQPIFVFQGDDGFLGYVPAIDQRFVQPAAGGVETTN